MRLLRLNLYMVWAFISLLIWILVMLLQTWIGSRADFIYFGLFFSILYSYIVTVNSSPFYFFRSVSSSTAKAWFEYALYVFSYILFNAIIYICLKRTPFDTLEGLQTKTLLELGINNVLIFFWILVWAFLVCFNVRPKKLEHEPLSRKKVYKGLGVITLMSFYLGISAAGFAVAPIVGCVVSVLPMCGVFYFDHAAINTLQPKLRAKIAIAMAFAVLLLGGITYGIAIVTHNYSFLGDVHKKELWQFDRVTNAQTIEDWSRWYQAKDRSLSPEEAVTSFDVLQKLCNEKVADDPSELRCSGQINHSFFIQEKWNDADIVTVLKKESTLAQRVALLQARSLKEFSPELTAAIQESRLKSPMLAVLADNTLTDQRANLSQNLEVRIKKLNAK